MPVICPLEDLIPFWGPLFKRGRNSVTFPASPWQRFMFGSFFEKTVLAGTPPGLGWVEDQNRPDENSLTSYSKGERFCKIGPLPKRLNRGLSIDFRASPSQAAAIQVQGRKSVEGQGQCWLPACGRVALFQVAQKLVLQIPKEKNLDVGLSHNPKDFGLIENWASQHLSWDRVFFYYFLWV